MQFKIGNRVKIKKDSKYYGIQSEDVGTIKMRDSQDWHVVYFDDGTCNSYHDEDLELAKEFKIGDRVECIKEGNVLKKGEVLKKGDKGVVIMLKSRGGLTGVRWDKNSPWLHSCEGNCPNHRGWYCKDSEIKLIEKETSVSKKILSQKRAKIIKEIQANPEFGKCFSSVSAIKKEVEAWNDDKILQWK